MASCFLFCLFCFCFFVSVGGYPMVGSSFGFALSFTGRNPRTAEFVSIAATKGFAQGQGIVDFLELQFFYFHTFPFLPFYPLFCLFLLFFALKVNTSGQKIEFRLHFGFVLMGTWMVFSTSEAKWIVTIFNRFLEEETPISRFSLFNVIYLVIKLNKCNLMVICSFYLLYFHFFF